MRPQAEEEGRRRGLVRYIKKKKLEPLETYVPAVVAARNQLQRAGSIMSEPPCSLESRLPPALLALRANVS